MSVKEFQDPEYFCEQLGFPMSLWRTNLAATWDEFCEKCDDSFPFFAEKEYFVRWQTFTGNTSPEIFRRMEETASILKKNPCGAFYANLLHYAIFQRDEPVNMGKMPLPEKMFGDNGGILQLLVAESYFPEIEKAYRKLGLPDEQLQGVGKWIAGTIQIYAAAHDGIPGHSIDQTSWIRHYAGDLFRIGRFEFLVHPYIGWMPAVYVNRNGTAIALYRAGTFMRENGSRFYADFPGAIRAHLIEKDGRVTGVPVMPDGSCDPHRYVSLDLKEWHSICAPWEIAPSVHIPGGERMSPELVRETFTKARDFFRKYLHADPKIFCCYSWILNPAWQEYLPGSNLAWFQKQGYRFPAWSSDQGGTDGIFFVFGSKVSTKEDVLKLRCNNKMETVMMKAYREKGGLHSGGLFILAEDADKVGTEYYLKKMDEVGRIIGENLCDAPSF